MSFKESTNALLAFRAMLDGKKVLYCTPTKTYELTAKEIEKRDKAPSQVKYIWVDEELPKDLEI